MDSTTAHQTAGDGVELNAFGKLTAQFLQYGQNASNNMQSAFTDMSLKNWIRLTVIVCTYLLLRPYFMKFMSQGALKRMEEEDAKAKALEKEKAKVSPNELRGVYDKLEEQEDEDGAAEATAADWGQKARVRQRTVLKQMLAAEEKKRQDEEDDKDIAEFLTE